jgi:cytochrome c553
MITRTTVLATLVVAEIMLASHFRKKVGKSPVTNSIAAIAEQPNYGGFESQLKWGEHLVTITGCNTCHYAANLNSDSTGISSWKEEQFIYAMREGKPKGLPGSGAMSPAMPWKDLSVMTDPELKAIFAYLKAAKPTSNTVPAPGAPLMVISKQ